MLRAVHKAIHKVDLKEVRREEHKVVMGPRNAGNGRYPHHQNSRNNSKTRNNARQPLKQQAGNAPVAAPANVFGINFVPNPKVNFIFDLGPL